MKSDIVTLRAYAIEMLAYDPDTGVAVWKKQIPRHARLIGKPVGALDSRGYRQVRLRGRLYLVHRIVFLMSHGFLPECLDHVNRNRTDNRLCNLRPASREENPRNCSLYKKRTGLPAGVAKVNRASYWAGIQVGKRKIYLGCYPTPELAGAAYRQAQITHFGEFCPQPGALTTAMEGRAAK